MEIEDIVEMPDFEKLKKVKPMELDRALKEVFRSPNAPVTIFEHRGGQWRPIPGTYFANPQKAFSTYNGFLSIEMDKMLNDQLSPRTERHYDIQEGIHIQRLQSRKAQIVGVQNVRGLVIMNDYAHDLFLRILD